MKKKQIAVLFGGCSSEYPVSLQSAYSVLSHLDKEKYSIIPLGITREGSWLRYYGDTQNVLNDTWYTDTGKCIPAIISPDRILGGLVEFAESGVKYTKLDAVFPVLHGKNGEDGTIQGLIEMTGIPLVGCNTLCSALCMDKFKAHRLVHAAGVAVPRAVVITQLADESTLLSQTRQLKYPLFVKPVRAGSSIGISKVYIKEDLLSAVTIAFDHDNEVIIEENIDGFEVGCAVLGNEELIIGKVDEIELTAGFFDYTEKYTMKTSKIHMPARIDTKMEQHIKKTAALIYKTLGCSGFARVDLFLTSDKKLVFNEVNTIPGFTSHSRYPNMMKGINLSFENILDKLIELSVS